MVNLNCFGGRLISLAPIAVALVVLLVLYSLFSRRTYPSEDIVKHHVGMDDGPKQLNADNKDRLGFHHTPAMYRERRPPKEARDRLHPGTTDNDKVSTAGVYSSSAFEKDETTTRASSLRRLSSLAAQTNSDTRKNVDRQAPRSEVDHFTNNSRNSHFNCNKIIAAYSSQPITDSKLMDVSKSCLGGYNSLSSIGPELFRKLFVENIFQLLECGDPVITVNKGPRLPVIALASFPGSGNTWTRVLLDQMTGIYTGSVFTDGMSNKILKGSLQCPYNKVFIIKTHKTGNGTSGKCGVKQLHYDSAIYILRNPYNAILAEFNREHAGKVGTASKQKFTSRTWKSDARGRSNGWEKHVQYWLSTFERSVHVLVYEDLVRNTLWELYKISKFVKYPVTFETMWCIQKRQKAQEAFKRKKPDWLKAENLFSSTQKATINQKIKDLIPQLTKHPDLKQQLSNYLL